MTSEDCFLLGTLVKTHGYGGSLLIKVKEPYQGKIEILESIFLFMDGILVPFFIDEIEEFSSSSYLMKIDEVNSNDEAVLFIGKDVYVPKEKFENVETSNLNTNSLLGYELQSNSNKKFGIIEDIREIPGNPIFSVKYENYEIMVPANEELILEINHKDKIITMIIPDGLFPG